MIQSSIRKRLIPCLLGLVTLFPFAATGGEGAAPSRLEARRLDGGRFSLADILGSVTVLVLWSPDSLASRKSLGELQRFVTGFQPRGVKVIAVSTAGDAEALRRFAETRKLDLPMAVLEDTDVGPAPEQALPVVYVFDRGANCRSIHHGLFRLRDLERRVEALLEE
jgi:hypothetical protein